MRAKFRLLGALALLLILAGCSTLPTTVTTASTATPSPTATTAPTATPTSPTLTGTLYMGAESTVYAINPNTGAKLWTRRVYPSDNAGRGVGPLTLVGNEIVFLNDLDQTLVAISKESGAPLWKVSGVQGPSGGGAFIVAGNVAVAAGAGLQVYNTTTAVDLRTGRVLWRQSLGANSLAAGGGLVYEARWLPGSDSEPITNGYIHALDAASGKLIWQATGKTYENLALVGSVLYASAADYLYAFDAPTGKLLWSHHFTVTNTVLPSLSVQRIGTMLYINNGQHVYALNGTSRQIVWQSTLIGTLQYQQTNSDLCASIPTQTSGQASASAPTPGVYGLDASSGKQLWHLSGSYVSLVADSGLCIAGGNPYTLDAINSGYPPNPEPLTALDVNTGATRWVGSIDASGNALAESGMLFVLSGGGQGGNAVLDGVSEATGAVLWRSATHYAVTNQIWLAYA